MSDAKVTFGELDDSKPWPHDPGDSSLHCGLTITLDAGVVRVTSFHRPIAERVTEAGIIHGVYDSFDASCAINFKLLLERLGVTPGRLLDEIGKEWREELAKELCYRLVQERDAERDRHTEIWDAVLDVRKRMGEILFGDAIDD